MSNGANDNPDMSHTLDRIDQLLAGDANEVKSAMSQVDRQLRGILVARIRRTAPGLSSAAVAEAYQEALLSIWQAAQQGKFGGQEPLLPLLLTIAHRRAVDALRRHTRSRQDYDELFDSVAERMADTRVGEAWREVARKEDGRRMMHLIRDQVASMPSRQRQVASVLIDHFPDVPTTAQICEAVRQAFGEELTPTAAKRAWQEARKKIRQCLSREGYMEIRDDD